jgi:ABC-2 type transport system ATP-binding protein
MNDFIDRNSRNFVRIRTPQPEQLADALAAERITAQRVPDGAFEADGQNPARIGDLAAAHGVTLHELSLQRASLEEAFMAMTAEAVEYHAGPGTPAATATGAEPEIRHELGADPVPGDSGSDTSWGSDWEQGRPRNSHRKDR